MMRQLNNCRLDLPFQILCPRADLDIFCGSVSSKYQARSAVVDYKAEAALVDRATFCDKFAGFDRALKNTALPCRREKSPDRNSVESGSGNLSQVTRERDYVDIVPLKKPHDV